MSQLNSYEEKVAFFSRVLTIYGRKPAVAALQDRALECHAVHLADSNRPATILQDIIDLAERRGISIRRHSRHALARISKNGKQDQGVAVDIICPGFQRLDDYLLALSGKLPQRLLALDGITNPQNLGMIVRSAVAGDIDGILWSGRGNAALGPLVIKASVGTLYRAPILICDDLQQGLRNCRAHSIEVATLAANAKLSLFAHRPKSHCVYVLGNETHGISPGVLDLSDTALSIPMQRGVESLNVAISASLIAYAHYFDK